MATVTPGENDLLSERELVWRDEYSQRRGRYEEFTVEVRRLLEKIIADQKLDVFDVDHRTKTVESFAEKISREGRCCTTRAGAEFAPSPLES
jgi:hypothetical protein